MIDPYFLYTKMCHSSSATVYLFQTMTQLCAANVHRRGSCRRVTESFVMCLKCQLPGRPAIEME